jgi:indole-3-glycerol phosphate synthase
MILDKIVEAKIIEVEQAKRIKPISLLLKKIKHLTPPRDFIHALTPKGPSIITEIKRHSPSRGPIWEDLDPSELARQYEQAGAASISVLTDIRFFHGSLEDLQKVYRAVSIPCLRKEFVADEYQIYESRASNADSLLLIVRILSDEQLKDYISLSHELGMEPLVEVHNENEVERAISAGAKIIGINNRDLDSLVVDMETTVRLKKNIPDGYIVVSESGISQPQTIQRFYELGVQAFLIGESVLHSRNPEQFIPWLLGKGALIQ